MKSWVYPGLCKGLSGIVATCGDLSVSNTWWHPSGRRNWDFWCPSSCSAERKGILYIFRFTVGIQNAEKWAVPQNRIITESLKCSYISVVKCNPYFFFFFQWSRNSKLISTGHWFSSFPLCYLVYHVERVLMVDFAVQSLCQSSSKLLAYWFLNSFKWLEISVFNDMLLDCAELNLAWLKWSFLKDTRASFPNFLIN